MQLSISAVRRLEPPPLWFVTNGEVTVGPVRTGLLLRGVVHGRIPEDCLVRELRWKSWRGLGQIREIRALRRHQAAGILSTDTPAPPALDLPGADAVLSQAIDAGEVLLLALDHAVMRTGASVGLVHRLVGPWAQPITCCARGSGLLGLLGEPVLEHDLMLGAARARRIVIGGPGATAVHRAAALRLGSGGDHRLSGVAMAPVCDGGELLAMLELGRTDHPFRAADGVELEAIVRAAAQRIQSN